jgi:hypothetical protein
MAEDLASRRWAPQGENPPSLLSGIYLAEFGLTLEERRRKVVRCADGRGICAKSLRAMEGYVRFLEGKLKLKVNRKKSAVGNPTKLKFLRLASAGAKKGCGRMGRC